MSIAACGGREIHSIKTISEKVHARVFELRGFERVSRLNMRLLSSNGRSQMHLTGQTYSVKWIFIVVKTNIHRLVNKKWNNMTQVVVQ